MNIFPRNGNLGCFATARPLTEARLALACCGVGCFDRAGLDEDEILNDEISTEEEDEADQDSNGQSRSSGARRNAGR